MMDIGTTKQLFVDDELIDSMVHVFQVLNPGRKHPGNPLLIADKPWEGRLVYVYGTALHDPSREGKNRFRLWYEASYAEEGDAGDRPGLLFAHSEDGINWEKPNLALASLNGSSDNNALWANNKGPVDPLPGIRGNWRV